MRTITVTNENLKNVIAETADALRAGAIVAIPTETVYGLAAHPDCPEAVARLSSVKGRPENKPIALLAADISAAIAFGAKFDPISQKIAQAFWPGALTIVLPCGEKEEGFRIPNHPLCRDLLVACGGILRVTSANLSGAQAAINAAQIIDNRELDVDIVLDNGANADGKASTVIRVANGLPEILRPGAVDAESITAAAQ